jgi:hypothetical protein
MELLMNTPPLHFVLERKAMESYVRVRKHGDEEWDGKHKKKKWLGHLQHWRGLGENFGNLDDNDIEVAEMHENRFNVNMDSLEGKKKYLNPS